MEELTIEQVTNEESKYSLVMAVAKLARKIGEKAFDDGSILTEKTVTMAINELKEHNYLIVETDNFKERC